MPPQADRVDWEISSVFFPCEVPMSSMDLKNNLCVLKGKSETAQQKMCFFHTLKDDIIFQFSCFFAFKRSPLRELYHDKYLISQLYNFVH